MDSYLVFLSQREVHYRCLGMQEQLHCGTGLHGAMLAIASLTDTRQCTRAQCWCNVDAINVWCWCNAVGVTVQ